jgi:predicted TIM-barrel fold metal-dependent hydrolase
MNPSVDECRKSNDLVLGLAEKKQGLVYRFCYVNPVNGHTEILEMRRCIRDHGMAGVKLWVGCRCNDERVRPIVEEAISLDVPILQHAFLRLCENCPGESYPSDVAALAAKYPEARIIMAHMGFNWRRGIAEIKDYPNVSVDTSGCDPEAGSVEYAVGMLGVDRVLYGSDAPGRDVLYQIGRVVAADLVRSLWAHIGYCILARLARFSPVSVHDGAVSVRRAYKPAELAELARLSRLVNWRIHRHILYRMTLVYEGRNDG